MRKVIYKYSISHKDAPELLATPPGEPFRMKMVKGAEILSVQAQAEISEQGIPQATGKIWAMCDPAEKEMVERRFVLIETGKEFDYADRQYIGTYQLYGGEIVLHLFEVVQ